LRVSYRGLRLRRRVRIEGKLRLRQVMLGVRRVRIELG
jgi:hypothetical protein